MTEITDAKVAEIQWASSEQGKAAVRAAWDKTKALGLGTRAVDMADIGAIVYAAYLAAGWDAETADSDEQAPARPVIKVNLTAPSESLTYAEILTPAGVVRVNVNLVNVQTGAPVVVVEVEPSAAHHPKTAAEDWDVEGRSVSLGARFDVTLTKRQDVPLDPRPVLRHPGPHSDPVTIDARRNHRGDPDA